MVVEIVCNVMNLGGLSADLSKEVHYVGG